MQMASKKPSLFDRSEEIPSKKRKQSTEITEEKSLAKKQRKITKSDSQEKKKKNLRSLKNQEGGRENIKKKLKMLKPVTLYIF